MEEIGRRHYVYLHLEAYKDRVFYVGKGVGDRHRSTSGRNIFWQRTAQKYGWRSFVLYDSLSEDCAFTMEKIVMFIAKKNGAKLVNLTNGGEGVSGLKHSDEAKEKLRKTSNSYWSNEEAIEERRIRTKEQWQDPEMRKKLIDACHRKWSRPEERERISRSQTGRKQSPEHAAKSRIAKLGKVVTEETREKLRAAWVIRKERKSHG